MILQRAISAILVYLFARCESCAPSLMPEESPPGHDAASPWTLREPSQPIQSHLDTFWKVQYSDMQAQLAEELVSRFEMTHRVMTRPGLHAWMLEEGHLQHAIVLRAE